MGQLSLQPKATGFIAANTHSQLTNATLKTFFEVLDEYNVPFVYNQQRKTITAGGRTIYAYSLENYDAIRGIQIGWAWLDETRDTSRAAFDVVIGRLRDPRSTNRQIRLTSTPNGFDWLYDLFAGPEKRASYACIYGRSQDNTHLPDGYVESLKESYDDKAYQQEVLGSFVDLTSGAVYSCFNRQENVKPVTRIPGVSVQIGLDFNLSPYAAVAAQVYDGKVYILKEYFLMGSNTHEMAEILINDWGLGTEIVPDSTGRALKTASRGLSDHQILKDAGLTVLTNRNPPRMDRYNCVNNLLDKRRLTIDPGCKHVVADLAKLVYKEGTNQPDLKDAKLGHIADALGYLCYYHFPIVRIESGVRQLR